MFLKSLFQILISFENNIQIFEKVNQALFLKAVSKNIVAKIRILLFTPNFLDHI